MNLWEINPSAPLSAAEKELSPNRNTGAPLKCRTRLAGAPPIPYRRLKLNLKFWIATNGEFRHDLLNGCLPKPLRPITCIVLRSCPIQAKKAGQPVDSQFPLQNLEGVPFKFVVSH